MAGSSQESLFARGFAADARTEAALRAGLADCKAEVRRARFATAVRTLASAPATSLVFVDFEGVADLAKAARALVAVCAPGTLLVAIGPQGEAAASAALLHAGAVDYLAKPVSSGDVREALAAVSDDHSEERVHAGRVVALAGSAGSGVTTLVAALARETAARGRTATVLDLDPLLGTFARVFETEPAGNLGALLDSLESRARGGEEEDLVVHPDEVSAVEAVAGPGVTLVAYPLTGPLAPAPSAPVLRALVAYLANRTHAVLLAGAPDVETRLEALRAGDTRVLLYEPTLASLSEAVRCLVLLGTQHPVTLVQSHSRMARSTLTAAQIRYALAERTADLVFAFDPALRTDAGRPPGKAWRKSLAHLLARVFD